MHDVRTSSATAPHEIDRRFQKILQTAVDTIELRLRSYDSDSDPLKQSHLKLLFDIVSSEVDRVAAGLGYIYAGLEAPIRAVHDWGEPPDSELVAALRDAEVFFRTDYSVGRNRARTVH